MLYSNWNMLYEINDEYETNHCGKNDYYVL